MKHAVDVANDVRNYIWLLTDYAVMLTMNQDGVFVKVGNTANKEARIVNVTKHFYDGGNWLQAKWLAVKLTYRLIKSLRKGN